MKNRDYWHQRFNILENAQNADARKTYADVERMFDEAQRDIESQVSVWYQRFADNNQISMQEARTLLNSRELDEFRWNVDEYIKKGEQNAISGQWAKQLENASARYHVSRLEALKFQAQNTLETLYGGYADAVDKELKEQYLNGYYRTMFEVQKGYGVGFDVAGIDENALSNVLKKPWTADSRTFSDRIWSDKTKLLDTVHMQLTQNLILGKPPDASIKQLASALNTSRHNAGRLIMTESAYFSMQSEHAAFEDLGVEQYEILATLDTHTSEICQGMDGQIFKMSEFDPGTTAPPFHPWCRTDIVPFFQDDFLGERAMRDPVTGKTEMVSMNIRYSQWKAKYAKKPIAPKGATPKLVKPKTQVSPEVEKIVTGLTPPIANDDASRKLFAEQIIDNIGVDRSNISVEIKQIKERGYCRFEKIENGKGYYEEFVLQSDDDRGINYQVKTTFHESYHLNAHGRETDMLTDRSKWVAIEETFAETSAHYAMQSYGIAEKLQPAYCNYLIDTLPRLKQTAEFSKCVSLADFGKIALETRLNGGGAEWVKLYDDIFAAAFDKEDYIKQYLYYAEQNADALIKKTFANAPSNAPYESYMKADLDNVFIKLNKGDKISTLSANEKMVFDEIFVAVMNELGVF